ncbi:cytosine permease, partial [Pseudomonas aeruginosa]
AGLISATIAVLSLPWHLYNSPGVILYFLGGLGALLAPLYGIIMVDYHLVRKGRVNLPELYTESRADAAEEVEDHPGAVVQVPGQEQHCEGRADQPGAAEVQQVRRQVGEYVG